VLVLRDGRVLLPEGKLIRADIVVGDDGRIAAVGSGLPVPAGARVLDAGGRAVLPGLIDLHTHLTAFEQDTTRLGRESRVALVAAQLALRSLRAGITTVRDVGGYRFVDIELRNAVAAGITPGPRILCAGLFICMTGGHVYNIGREADGPYEMRKAAREQLRAGADFIKVMASGGVERGDESIDTSQLEYDELKAAVDVAADAGTVVVAHAHPPRAIKQAVKAGVASIEHGTLLDEEAAEMMVERGTFLVPTFAVYDYIARSGPVVLRERAAMVAETKRKTFLMAVGKGVRWGVGTDSGGFSPVESIVDELVILRGLGLPAAEVLRRATSFNAELAGLSDTGSISMGKRADLIVVDGDPIEDLTSLRHVVATVKNGVVFDWATSPA